MKLGNLDTEMVHSEPGMRLWFEAPVSEQRSKQTGEEVTPGKIWTPRRLTCSVLGNYVTEDFEERMDAYTLGRRTAVAQCPEESVEMSAEDIVLLKKAVRVAAEQTDLSNMVIGPLMVEIALAQTMGAPKLLDKPTKSGIGDDF